jgi:hypothetical protein
MDTLGTLFAWTDLPGHASYILIAVSYYLTSIYWLRVTAVMGLFLEIIYFRLSGGDMSAGIGWDLVFILINLWQIYWLVEERRKLSRIKDAHLLRRGVFAGFDDAKIAGLLSSGTWRDLCEGAVLTRAGEPVRELTLLCDGAATVDIEGHTIARLSNGAFVGEMAFITGKPASATVTVDQPTRAFVFEMEKLRKLVEGDETVATAIHRVIGRDLAVKLRSLNQS